jgi:hypothetical protein
VSETPETAPEPNVAGFSWPVPDGWQAETIPFPLEFAPELAHRGIEELRFMDGFFHPESPRHWSYALAWWLEDDPPSDEEGLARELATYFRGLCMAVDAGAHAFDPLRFAARLQAVDAGTSADGRNILMSEGEIATYDPFKTGRPITLHVRIRRLACQGAGHNVLLLAASPRPYDDPVWVDLDTQLSAFRCP